METWPRAKGYRVRMPAGGAGRPHTARGTGRFRRGWQRTTFRTISDRSQWLQAETDALLGTMTGMLGVRLADNARVMRQRLGANSDIVFRPLHIAAAVPIPALLVYVDGMVNTAEIGEQVLEALVRPDMAEWLGGPRQAGDPSPLTPEATLQLVRSRLFSAPQLRATRKFGDVVGGVLEGDTALLVDGCDEAVLMQIRQFPHRDISPPQTESVIRGPREAFIEPIRTNTALIRRRINSASLRIEGMQLGRRSKTDLAICYLADVAAPDLVLEVKRRLKAIDIDAIQASGYLEQYIEDNHYSPFPQVVITERPDVAVGNILEGRVAIISDGSPFVLIVPAQFSMFYQSSEDYYERVGLATLVRIVRLVSLSMSLTLSALYVSLVAFHPEMIPTKFAVAVAGGRAGVPVPAVLEILSLEVVMEVLREASLHLPKQIGSAISIVGILVIGQAAVSSGFVSPIAVVIVAATAVGSFATPAFNAATALRVLRFPLIVLAGIFGLYGLVVGLIVIVNHLLSLESFGVAYATPVAPLEPGGVGDSVIRLPLWLQPRRPESVHPLDARRTRTKPGDVLDAKRPTLDPARGQGGEAP